MPDSLAPETGGPLEEDSDGNLTLPQAELDNWVQDAISIVRYGTIAGSPAASILGIFDIGAMVLEFEGSEDAANVLETKHAEGTLQATDLGLGGALSAMAEFLNVSIDSPVAKTTIGFVDPTIVVAKIKLTIEDVIKEVQETVETGLTMAKEALGDKLQEIIASVNFQIDDLTLPEVMEKLVDGVEKLAALIAAMLRPSKFLDALDEFLALFGIPGIGEIKDTIASTIEAIKDVIDSLDDLKKQTRDSVKSLIETIAQGVKDSLKEKIKEAVMAALEAIASISLPSLPALPQFITDLPITARELFPDLPDPLTLPEFLSIDPRPNVLTEAYELFQEVLKFFTNTVPSLDWIMGLLGALAGGIIGLVEFIAQTVIDIFKAAFQIEEGFHFKAGLLIAFITRVVDYLSSSLVGYVLGDGMIFQSTKKTFLSGSSEFVDAGMPAG